MEPIFSRHGHVIGWLKQDVVYDEAGEPRAAVRNGALFAFDGSYLGRLERGYFRDQNGDALAFMTGAAGVPLTPTPRVVPTPPTTRSLLITPAVRVVPREAPASAQWSKLDWTAFLRGESSGTASE